MSTQQADIDFAKIKEHLNSNEYTPWIWLFFGDSITHGVYHTHGFRSFPEIFSERVRYELSKTKDLVINSGISGRHCGQLLDDDYDHLVKRHHPEVVFILIGTNDIVRYNDSNLFKQYLTTLVRRLRSEGSIPILQTCTPVYKDEANPNVLERFNKLPLYVSIIKEVANSESVILIDHDAHWKEVANDENSLKRLLGNPIHPGGIGHLEMAITIFNALGIYDKDSFCVNPIGVPQSMLD